MFGACRDLRELKRVCENLYPKYVEPLRSGTIERGNAGKLYNHLHGHLKQAIQSLYRRTRVSRLLSHGRCKLLLGPGARIFLVTCTSSSHPSPLGSKKIRSMCALTCISESRGRRAQGGHESYINNTLPVGERKGTDSVLLSCREKPAENGQSLLYIPASTAQEKEKVILLGFKDDR